MKTRFICGVSVMALLSILSSCNKKDDAKPDPIIGIWERDYYSLSEAPSNFSKQFDGYYAPNPYSSNGIFGDQSYTLTLKGDKSYNLSIAFAGPDYADNGKWVVEAKKLTLNSSSSNTPSDEYTIEEDVTAAKLVIAKTITYTEVLPDVINDTLTVWANTHQSAYTAYLQNVDVKVTFHFNKKNP